MTANLAVLASDDGRSLQTILDACVAKTLDARVVFVVSNRRHARALDCAEMAGVPTLYHPLKWYIETGRTRQDYDAELARLVLQHKPDWVVLLGWKHILSRTFLEHFPDRVINLHSALPDQLSGTVSSTEAIAHAAEHKLLIETLRTLLS